jgi:N-acetyl-gamma-glutamyl-phosphate reductase
MVLIAPDDAQKQSVDCVFSCLPHAASAALCLPLIKKGVRVIDLSADFRIKDPAIYTQWYSIEHPCPELLEQAIFGLPEQYRSSIATARILANPGCYSTSVMLPLIPLLREKGSDITMIIADSKSGVSGAGRSLKLATQYVEAHDNFSAYSVGRTHRHLAEIDQELSKAGGRSINITFSPHLLPLTRGILSTIYISTALSASECLDCIKTAYAKEPFVRVREPDDRPSIRDVAHTNFCDISLAGGNNGQPVIIVSALDNLLKGASGQAVQNMNIMFGFDEASALM